jgi:hypothetical protein
MANNPADRMETFTEPLVEPGVLFDWGLMSKLDAIIYGMNQLTTKIPAGWVLVADQWSPSLPAGVYRKNSLWSERYEDEDSWTEEFYRVTSIEHLMYDEASPSQRFVYDSMDEIVSYLEAGTNINWGPDKFGYMRSVGSSSGAMSTGVSALELAESKGIYDPTTMGTVGTDKKPKTSDQRAIPWWVWLGIALLRRG